MHNNRTKIATDAVIKACELCQQVQSEMVLTDAIQKNDRSPVTVADFGSQALVCKVISDAYPENNIVAEESAQALKKNPKLLERVTDYVQRFVSNETQNTDTFSSEKVCDLIDMGGSSIGDSYWTLDPIDGTKGFLRQDQYAVALAWIVKGEVQIGVLGCPNLPYELNNPDSERGCLFVAEKTKGTTIYTLNGEYLSEAKVSSNSSRLAESFESTHGDTNTHTIVANQLGFNKPPLKIDSQAKYGVVARGEASLYIRLPNPEYPDYRECIWDHAAGLIVVEEAGGKVTDANGQPLNFLSGRRMKDNRGVVATNGTLHKDVLSIVSTI